MQTEPIFCKLCKNNHADKTNSHIVSRFLTKDILGTNGPRVAHILDTSRPLNKPKKSQDSPKEDYILCSECEKYFEVLETYVAERITKRYGNPIYVDDFVIKNEEYIGSFAIAEKVSPIIMKLFIYSIFWRSSISQLPLFNNFKLKDKEEELLRFFLLEYKKYNIKELKENILPYDFPYVVLRPEQKDQDPSKNFLYANDGNEDIYQIIANEYVFFLAFEVKGTISKFNKIINRGVDKVSIGLLKTSTWENLRQGMYNHAAKLAMKNADKINDKE